KKFDLKTIDTAGRIIPQLPHEVSAEIKVNGEDIKLVRRFTENWVKRSGEIDRVFTGNTQEYFYNDVPCSEKEYNAKIANICAETIFKFITSPTYFTAQKAETQKSMLLRMAGEISDTEIASGNEDFTKLLEALTGKTLAEYKREVSAKKSLIRNGSDKSGTDGLNGIPSRIDEKKRDLAGLEVEDWKSLESEISAKKSERDNIQAQIESEYEAIKTAETDRTNLLRELSAKRNERLSRAETIKGEVTREYLQKKRERDTLSDEIQTLNRRIANLQSVISNDETEIALCNNKREVLVSQLASLGVRANEIRLEKLTIDESEFVCPTCKRPLELEDIENRQSELEKHFETERGKRLQEVADAIEENQRKGKANNAKKQSFEADIVSCREKIGLAQKRIDEINGLEIMKANLVEPDAEPQIKADTVIIALDDEISKLEAKITAEPERTSNAELKKQRDQLSNEIESLNHRLSKRDTIKRVEARITELESTQTALNEELSQLEKIEFVMLEFSKAKSAAIEKRIDGLFSFVKFRWIETAVNGAESETCEATLNGKPYSTCSNAERILIGLDIINAICKSEGVYAPIFVDNAESINDIIPMQSQIISLIVSRDDRLIIEAGDTQKNLFQ
ncbi:MAG: hypothetical protein NC548_52425, partial [Lachnospiraceae bacterium]|nr:hypothetical protein [Lachnospiraceae bacterium]